MIYGHDKTIHGTEHVDVELGEFGEVVAVWFRCLALPFQSSRATRSRAQEMRRMYAEREMPGLIAVEVRDK